MGKWLDDVLTEEAKQSTVADNAIDGVALCRTAEEVKSIYAAHESTPLSRPVS